MATATLQPPGPHCSRSLDRECYLKDSGDEPQTLPPARQSIQFGTRRLASKPERRFVEPRNKPSTNSRRLLRLLYADCSAKQTCMSTRRRWYSQSGRTQRKADRKVDAWLMSLFGIAIDPQTSTMCWPPLLRPPANPRPSLEPLDQRRHHFRRLARRTVPAPFAKTRTTKTKPRAHLAKSETRMP